MRLLALIASLAIVVAIAVGRVLRSAQCSVPARCSTWARARVVEQIEVRICGRTASDSTSACSTPREMRRRERRRRARRHDTVSSAAATAVVSAAAAAFSGGDKVLGVLPFGTMNLLARDLGMPADPQAAVAALADARVPRRIDLAEINGRPFHTLSGLGFFSHMARAREEVRGHPLGRSRRRRCSRACRALRRTAPSSVDIVVEGQARAGHGARRARHQQPLRRRLAAAAARRRRARNAHRRGPAR